MEDLERKRRRDKEWAAAHPEAKREAAKRYRAKRAPGRAAAYNREWRSANILKELVRKAKSRAIKQRLAFDPDILSELLQIGVPALCPVYGIEIVIGGRTLSAGSPSLDRVFPTAGYVRGNVRVISWLANRHKSNASAEQHEAIARYIRDITLKDRASAVIQDCRGVR